MLPASVVAVVVEMYGVSVSVGARPSPRPRRAAAAGGLASRGTMLINLAMVAVAERGGWGPRVGRVVLADAHCVMDVWPAALRCSDARSIRTDGTGDAEALEERGNGAVRRGAAEH